MKFADSLYFHPAPFNGLYALFNGETLDPISHNHTTSRRFFRFSHAGKDYFLKAETDFYNGSQCLQEGRLWDKIKPQHRKYFVPVIEYGVTNEVYWSLFPFIELTKAPFSKEAANIVAKLTHTYGISDVNGWFNDQWYIVNGKPLIVDYGL